MARLAMRRVPWRYDSQHPRPATVPTYNRAPPHAPRPGRAHHAAVGHGGHALVIAGVDHRCRIRRASSPGRGVV